MSWIKEANKIGEYVRSYKGFRIYCTKKLEMKQREEMREDGLYRVTEFTPGWLVAVDKNGFRVEDRGMESIAYKIDIEDIQRYYDKKESKQ